MKNKRKLPPPRVEFEEWERDPKTQEALGKIYVAKIPLRQKPTRARLAAMQRLAQGTDAELIASVADYLNRTSSGPEFRRFFLPIDTTKAKYLLRALGLLPHTKPQNSPRPAPATLRNKGRKK